MESECGWILNMDLPKQSEILNAFKRYAGIRSMLNMQKFTKSRKNFFKLPTSYRKFGSKDHENKKEYV